MVLPPAAATTATAPAPATAVTPPVVESRSVKLEALTMTPSAHRSPAPVPIVAMAHIEAPKAVANAKERKPLSVSAVMDVSGSMRGEKLGMAKQALSFVLNELTDRDRFGVIAFDNNVTEPQPLVATTLANKPRALAAISGLSDGGSTNISGGLFAGVAQCRGLPFTAGNAGVSVPMQMMGGNRRRGTAPSSLRSPPPAGFGSVGVNFGVHPQDGSAFRLTLGFSAAGNGQVVVAVPGAAEKVADLGIGGDVSFVGLAERPAAVTLRFMYPRGGDCVALLQLCGLEKGTATVTPVAGQTIMANAAAVATVPPPPVPAGVGSDEFTRVVMLFTDGQANCGITEGSALARALERELAKDPIKDVTVFTFGFGNGHNAGMLQCITEPTQGMYYFVESAARMPEIFADCLGGLLSIAAQGITVTFTPRPGVTIQRLRTQFPVRIEGPSQIVQLKDLYSEERRDLVADLAVTTAGVDASTAPLLDVLLRCENVLLGRHEEVAAHTTVAITDEPYTGAACERVQEQVTRVDVAEALDQARAQADAGDVAGAREMLATRKKAFKARQQTAFSSAVVDDMDEAEQCMESTSRWAQDGEKRVSRMHGAHAKQRANVLMSDMNAATSAYTNMSKCQMQQQAQH